MAIREQNAGLTYLRRSSDDQPSSLETQLHWARQAASQAGVHLEGGSVDLDAALKNGAVSVKSLRLDNAITGADLNRPGLQALIRDAIGDPAISHVYIHKPDRLARPDDPIDGMAIERRLTAVGITIVFSTRTNRPSASGESDLSTSILSLVDYHESGNFLKLHAERVLLTQRRLAERGFWTGGRAPYGFERALLLPNGKIELLAPGRRVRQAGCHVIIVPHDYAKIAVWTRILDLADAGWGSKRIATLLTKEGISSPDAGRTRHDHGISHQVSGVWQPNTVKDLIENRAILAMLDFGRRSEGRHRRLSADGIRTLNDDDRRDDRSTKTIRNDASLVISAALPYDKLFDADKWEGIQRKRKARGSSQRGVPRARDLGQFPLSCRTIDLSDGCGHPMYGRKHGNRKILVCGRYTKSNGRTCNNNSVDAEAVLSFVLNTLRQIIAVHGGRERIEQMLRTKACEARTSPTAEAHAKAVGSLERSLAECEVNIGTATRRLVTVEDELLPDVKAALRALKSDMLCIQRQLVDERQRAPAHPTDPEQEVRAALALLDRLDAVTSDAPARRELSALFRQLNLWLGLEFTEGIKGTKRRIRQLSCGILTFDAEQLPVPPFGKDHLGDDDEPNCPADTSQNANSNQEEKLATSECRFEMENAHDVVGESVNRRREGVSSTKVIRGDWI